MPHQFNVTQDASVMKGRVPSLVPDGQVSLEGKQYLRHVDQVTLTRQVQRRHAPDGLLVRVGVVNEQGLDNLGPVVQSCHVQRRVAVRVATVDVQDARVGRAGGGVVDADVALAERVALGGGRSPRRRRRRRKRVYAEVVAREADVAEADGPEALVDSGVDGFLVQPVLATPFHEHRCPLAAHLQRNKSR